MRLSTVAVLYKILKSQVTKNEQIGLHQVIVYVAEGQLNAETDSGDVCKPGSTKEYIQSIWKTPATKQKSI